MKKIMPHGQNVALNSHAQKNYNFCYAIDTGRVIVCTLWQIQDAAAEGVPYNSNTI